MFAHAHIAAYWLHRFRAKGGRTAHYRKHLEHQRESQDFEAAVEQARREGAAVPRLSAMLPFGGFTDKELKGELDDGRPLTDESGHPY